MIEVRNLTKKYGNHLAVEDLSFTVEAGMIYGFLGPNGAGKSTTMNILTGCLAATSGEALINGFDILEEPREAKKCIGYLPEQPPLYLGRTVREYLRFVAEAKGVEKAKAADEIARVMAATGIEAYENRLIRHMSKGYRQRVGIAEALIGDPEVIILDEPTVGLDPQQIVEIRELIASLKGDHTVILSSHILSEVQSVCEKVIIINHGRIVALDTPENLEKLFRRSLVVEAELDDPGERAEEILREKMDGLADVTVEGKGEECRVLLNSTGAHEKELKRTLFFAAAEAGIPILSLNVQHANLEEVFLELTQTDGETEETPEETEGRSAETVEEAPETEEKAGAAEGGDPS